MESVLILATKSLTVTNKYIDKSLNEAVITIGSDDKYHYYSYLFFDTSLIPCNAIISKAELVLFKTDKFYDNDSQKISISPLKDYFSTYTTYNTPPYYDHYTIINFYPLTSKVAITINIFTIISSWVKNPSSNKGIILYAKNKVDIINFGSVKSNDDYIIPFIRVTYKTYPFNKDNHIEKCDFAHKCYFTNKCPCNENCSKICKEDLKAILIEVCKEVCCNNCNPQPDNSTVRQVRVTGTVQPLSIYFIIVNIEVTRAGSGLIDNYYVSDQYDNSLSNTPLYIDKLYDIAIIPKIQPGDVETVNLYGSYKGPISVVN